MAAVGIKGLTESPALVFIAGRRIGCT